MVSSKRLLSSLIILLLVVGCEPVFLNDPVDVEGYVPIYGERGNSEIKLMPAQTVTAPGKIYVYGKYLLINEVRRGIHVFDNSDITDPQPLAFLQLLGNIDMAIKDDVLYADCMGELVAINVNSFDHIEKVGALPLNKWLLGVPPPEAGYFECIDESRGIVVGWTKETLSNPKCRFYGTGF